MTVGWLSDNRIAYSSLASGSPEIWAVDADGSRLKQLTHEANFGFLGDFQACTGGRYLLTASWQPGIWRFETDGTNPKQLTTFDNPFNDWCGFDSGPGEICAEPAGSRADKYSNRTNAQTRKTLHGAKVFCATALVRSCSMNSVSPRTKPPRDIDRTSVTSENCSQFRCRWPSTLVPMSTLPPRALVDGHLAQHQRVPRSPDAFVRAAEGNGSSSCPSGARHVKEPSFLDPCDHSPTAKASAPSTAPPPPSYRFLNSREKFFVQPPLGPEAARSQL